MQNSSGNEPKFSAATLTTSHANQRASKSAVIGLTIAAAFWGFGFVAVVWALKFFGPLGVTGWRFALASVVGVTVVVSVPSLRRQFHWDEVKLAFWPGVFLAITLVLQTWGLKYTTATKSGFITTLYVLVVPLLESVVLKRKTPRYHLVYVALALVGVALICEIPQMILNMQSATEAGISSERTKRNIGDWLTLGCMLAASMQIFWFGMIQKKITSSFNFSVYQTVWAGLLPLPLALYFEPLPPGIPGGLPLLGLCMVAFGSTLIAFALQVRAQKTISPSMASLLFLLESPFAALFAYFLLDERFTTQGALGGALILVALGSSVVFGKEAAEKELVT